MRRRDSAVDGYFPTPRHDGGEVRLTELPYITRPLVEHLHDQRPAVVIAGDRGGRLVAFSAIRAWNSRYPGERFPTLDGSIQFARVSSRSASANYVTKAVHHALARGGLVGEGGEMLSRHELRQARVAYMDDWMCEGGTLNRFVQAAESYGIQPDNISYLTMCGPTTKKLKVGHHVIGDPDRDPRDADWNNRPGYVGVDFWGSDGVTPTVLYSGEAVGVRNTVVSATEAYYQRFQAALASGQIAACACAV